MKLALDQEAIDTLVRELTATADALGKVAEYAASDDLTAVHFGPLATRTGAAEAFVQKRDALRDSVGRTPSVLDAMAGLVSESVRLVREADEENAALIKRAGGD